MSISASVGISSKSILVKTLSFTKSIISAVLLPKYMVSANFVLGEAMILFGSPESLISYKGAAPPLS